MKKSLIIAAVASLALAACNSEEATEAPAETEAAAAVPAAAEVQLAADGQPAEGTYEVTLADGTVLTEVVNADGTYTWTSSDGTTGAGTWRTDGPNVWCTTEEGEEESCNDETINADGVWTTIDRETPDEVATVVRVVAE
ncbi:MAG: hypothetical protein JY451_00650 [Erythrobacter sp.]|nr:MAG: hypothetical protein JY451_00650 [Erythrobacter sp.]